MFMKRELIAIIIAFILVAVLVFFVESLNQNTPEHPLPMYNINWVNGEHITLRNGVFYTNFSVNRAIVINYTIDYVNIEPSLDGGAFILNNAQFISELPPSYGTTPANYSDEFVQNTIFYGYGNYSLVFVVYGIEEIQFNSVI